MKKIIFLLSFFLVACSPAAGVSGVTPAQVMAIATQPQPIQPTATPTIVPTATLDHAATLAAANVDTENMRQMAYQAQQEALNYQNTSIAAGVIIVQITAQYEQQQVVIMQATQEADRLTAQSNMWTVTAQPTADAIRVTQIAMDMAKIILESGRLTATAEAPALIAAINTAENVAKFGWLDYFARVMLAMAAVVVPVGLVAVVLRKVPQKLEPFIVPELDPIPLTPHSDNDNLLLRSELLCSDYQLLEIARGVTDEGRTLAYNQWSGFNYGALKNIRKSFVSHGFAYELQGKQGELEITDAGRAFLEYVTINGELPAPWKCLVTTSPTAPLPPKSGTIAATGDINHL